MKKFDVTSNVLTLEFPNEEFAQLFKVTLCENWEVIFSKNGFFVVPDFLSEEPNRINFVRDVGDNERKVLESVDFREDYTDLEIEHIKGLIEKAQEKDRQERADDSISFSVMYGVAET